MEATEKVYSDYQITAVNPGGHSSRPRADNAIYELTAALNKLAVYTFPFEMNEVTRTYFTRLAGQETGQTAADMRAILATPPDLAAAAHLSAADYLGDVPWNENEAAKNWYARVKSRPSFRTLLADTLAGLPPSKSYADLDF